MFGRFFKRRTKNAQKCIGKETGREEIIATSKKHKEEHVEIHNEIVEEECIICLASVRHDSEDGDLVTLSCSHLFHRGCILEWYDINRTCPTCRKTLGGKENFVRECFEKRRLERRDASELRARRAGDAQGNRERLHQAARIHEVNNRARIQQALYARPDP